MLHNLLPNKERLHKIKKSATPYCIFCPELLVDNIDHLFNCRKYSNILTPVLHLLNTILPETSVTEITSLRFSLETSTELPVMWILSTTLMLVWNARIEGKNLSFPSFKAEVQASLLILKSTKWKYYSLHNSALVLNQMLENNLWNLNAFTWP